MVLFIFQLVPSSKVRGALEAPWRVESVFNEPPGIAGIPRVDLHRRRTTGATEGSGRQPARSIESIVLHGPCFVNEHDCARLAPGRIVHIPVSYTHLRAHETRHDLVCRLLLEKK